MTPHYFRLWMNSCDKMYIKGVHCMLNIVLWSDEDNRTDISSILPCPAQNTSKVLIKIWSKKEFYDTLNQIGVPRKQPYLQLNKLIDFKPLYGVLIEKYLHGHKHTRFNVKHNPFHTLQSYWEQHGHIPFCYKHWGWSDSDGMLGNRLLDEIQHHQCATDPTSVQIYPCKGGWQFPIWSGQLTTFCNVPQGRNLYKLCPNYLQYLLADETVLFDELKLHKCLGRSFESHVRSAEESQAADYYNYVVDNTVPEVFSVSEDQGITGPIGKEFVYIHFGSSKQTGLRDDHFPLTCDKPIPPAFKVTFDAKNKQTYLESL